MNVFPDLVPFRMIRQMSIIAAQLSTKMTFSQMVLGSVNFRMVWEMIYRLKKAQLLGAENADYMY